MPIINGKELNNEPNQIARPQHYQLPRLVAMERAQVYSRACISIVLRG